MDPPLTSAKSFNSSDFTKRQWTGQAPEGAVAVNIRAIMTGKGSAWFDDVIWEEKGSNKTGNWVYYLIGFAVPVVIYFVFNKFFKK